MTPSDRQPSAALADALRRGDAVEAGRLALALVRATPGHEEAYNALIALAAARGDDAEACRLAEQGAREAPESALLQFHLGTARESLSDFAGARDAYFRAQVLDPALLMALVARGAMERALGNREQALRCTVPGLAAAERTGWLARLPSLPAPHRARLESAIEFVREARAYGVHEALAPVVARHGAGAVARVLEAVRARYEGGPALPMPPLQRPSFLFVPGLPAQPWFEREQFPFLAALEAETDAIRSELLAVLAEDGGELAPYVDMPDTAPAAVMWQELNRSVRWTGYHFHRHGERIEAHCRRCPRTAAAIDALPLLRIPDHGPEVLFSVLRPGTHIPPHTGVINGRLIAHLPLIVPPECGALAAGGSARPWQEGRCLVFDDSFVHEAWNQSNQVRVVLIFDLWNPHLPEPEREALSAAIAAIGEFNRRYEGPGKPPS